MEKYDPNDNDHLIAQVKDRLRSNHGLTVELWPYSRVDSYSKTITHLITLHISYPRGDVFGDCLFPRGREDLIYWVLSKCERSLDAGNGLPESVALRMEPNKKGSAAPFSDTNVSDAPGTVYH